MLIESYQKGGYQVLNIKEDLTISSDVSELKMLISGYMSRKVLNIALLFTKDSYLYTKSISILVQCLELVREHGGSLAIINPNEDIQDIMNTLDFNRVIRVFPSEDDIAPPAAAADQKGSA